MKRIIPIISALLFIIAMSIGFYTNLTSFSADATATEIVLSIIFDVTIILFSAFAIVELIKQDDNRKGMVFFNSIFIAMEISGLISYLYSISAVIASIPPGYTLDPSSYVNIGFNVGLYLDIIPFFIVAAAVSGKVEKLRKIMMTIGLSVVLIVEFISYMNIMSMIIPPISYTVMELVITFGIVLAAIGTWTITYKRQTEIK